MRGIKFRAWDKENKKMWNENHIAVIGNTVLAYETHHTCGKKKGLYYMFDVTKTYIPLQYTGLKDMDGVEIYEGDVIEYTFAGDGKFIGEVVAQFATFSVQGLPLNNINKANGKGVGHINVKVIGNIYENKELLT